MHTQKNFSLLNVETHAHTRTHTRTHTLCLSTIYIIMDTVVWLMSGVGLTTAVGVIAVPHHYNNSQRVHASPTKPHHC